MSSEPADEQALLKAATLDAVGQLAQGRIRARHGCGGGRARRDRAAELFETDWRRNWPGLAALIDHDKENPA